MIRMGLKGNVTTDSHLMKISASLLSHSDMFIAMSNSGNTSELISAAEVANLMVHMSLPSQILKVVTTRLYS